MQENPRAEHGDRDEDGLNARCESMRRVSPAELLRERESREAEKVPRVSGRDGQTREPGDRCDGSERGCINGGLVRASHTTDEKEAQRRRRENEEPARSRRVGKDHSAREQRDQPPKR